MPLFFSCSANVLLDLSFRAKVGDFGLARAIGGEQTMAQAQTARVVGTSGYIAPEYFRGTITTKLDTYAFGVVRDCSLCPSAPHNHFLLADIIGAHDWSGKLR